MESENLKKGIPSQLGTPSFIPLIIARNKITLFAVKCKPFYSFYEFFMKNVQNFCKSEKNLSLFISHENLSLADRAEELHLLFYRRLDGLCARRKELARIKALAL